MLSVVAKRLLTTTAAVASTLAAALFVVPSSGLSATTMQDDFPTMGNKAMAYYEGRVDNWTSGPAEMLMTVEEHEIWGSLEDDTQRQEFKRWFWYRRDPDGREIGNEFQEDFYEEVAEANKKYRGFPRGWKSDRGRAHLILGRPDAQVRRSWGDIYGSGNGPDFEVWSYYSLTQGRAFTAQSGEFNVYFSEQRIGNFEIWDFQWGAGVWDRNIRLAMEWSIEAHIIDPMTPFEGSTSEGEFVREISEGTLPVAIPVDLWSDLGGGGMISVPVEIKLGDLLFEPTEEEFIARLDATMTLQPGGSADPIRVAESWQVRLHQDQLGAVGSGSLVAALSAAVDVGEYATTLVVQHPLAASESEWSQPVGVNEEPATAIVVGKLALELSEEKPSAVAILGPSDATFDGGGPLVVGIWARGLQPQASAVSVHLEAATGGTHVVALDSVRWLDGTAGPLLIEAQLPDLEAGEYRLLVDLGAGVDFASTPITVGR